MKITISKGKKKVKISKKEWQNIGKKANWIKKYQTIPDNGFSDGGIEYTNDEMDLIRIEEIKGNDNRPEKIKQLMDLYVDMHPTCSGYELNTLWDDLGQMSTEEINQYIDKYVSTWTREPELS